MKHSSGVPRAHVSGQSLLAQDRHVQFCCNPWLDLPPIITGTALLVGQCSQPPSVASFSPICCIVQRRWLHAHCYIAPPVLSTVPWQGGAAKLFRLTCGKRQPCLKAHQDFQSCRPHRGNRPIKTPTNSRHQSAAKDMPLVPTQPHTCRDSALAHPGFNRHARFASFSAREARWVGSMPKRARRSDCSAGRLRYC